MIETETQPTTTAYDVPPEWADRLYEVVDGQFVEPTPMGILESIVANFLNRAILFHFAATREMGWVVLEGIFLLSISPKRQRRPDLAFVSYERWPRERGLPQTAAWEVIPDLAVEVISPGNSAIEILEKLDDYFRAGVRRVWVIYPRQGFIQDFRAFDQLAVLRSGDTLEGGDVLPGFKIKLADLFSDGAAPAE